MRQRLWSKARIVFLLDCHPNMHLQYNFRNDSSDAEGEVGWGSACVSVPPSRALPGARTLEAVHERSILRRSPAGRVAGGHHSGLLLYAGVQAPAHPVPGEGTTAQWSSCVSAHAFPDGVLHGAMRQLGRTLRQLALKHSRVCLPSVSGACVVRCPAGQEGQAGSRGPRAFQ